MNYKGYYIYKLFTSQYGDTDLQKKDITNTGYPIITSGVDKNGILGLTDRSAKIIDADTITIDMFGNAFYRPFKYKMVTHARVFSLEPINFKMNERIGLYIVTQFHYLTQLYSYTNGCSFNKIKNNKIFLPTLNKINPKSPYSDEGYVPDWEYMENYIAELEKGRVAELEKYLIATGLNDYELTEEDKHILSLSLENQGITKMDIQKILMEFGGKNSE